MIELGWPLIVIGGIVVLGIAIAYGMMRNKARTYPEKVATERGTERIYEKEDRSA